MSLWKSLAGMVQIRLTSADPEGALAQIARAGISIFDVEKTDDLTWQFTVSQTNGKKIQTIANKRGESVVSISRAGIFWSLLQLRKRMVLICGLLLLAMLSTWVPSRVFFVQVEGNVTVPSRMIVDNAIKCGIHFGASRKEVRSERVKNQLLAQLPELQWAGVNTAGCVAEISVCERSVEEKQNKKPAVSSIVAAADGIIAEMTALNGNVLCKPGQAVKAGQVLISGYTDCGICIRATRAEGEILAHTQRRLSAVFPEERAVRGKIVGTEEKFSLIIGKKQINFSKYSGISGASCAKIYEQKYMTLPGGFELPVSFVRERITYYETSVGAEKDIESSLRYFARNYVTKQTLAGKIENEQIYISSAEGLSRLEGVFSCLEQIGVERAEESLPSYGKSD